MLRCVFRQVGFMIFKCKHTLYMSLIAGPSHMTTHILDWYFKHTNSAFLVASCWFFSSSFRTKELSSTFFLCSILNSWLPPFESCEKKYNNLSVNLSYLHLAQIFQLVSHLKGTSHNIEKKCLTFHWDVR